MLFTSLWFYAALAPALGVFHLTPARARVACLLVLSCAFYLYADAQAFWLLAAMTVVTFLAGRAIASAASDRMRLARLLAGLLPIVALLVGLKSAGAWRGTVLPLGVSYYVFRLISYLLDVYWDEAQVERKFVDFAAFVTFAPQMLSGPIQRSHQFLRQVPRLRSGAFDRDQFERGFFTILRGLLLKLLIGDRLGAFIGLVDAAPQNYSRTVVLTAVMAYGVQLYADFAGYTLIAIGLGRLFGIEAPPNFNAPFRAANIQDFWRRWHISLSSWVADYVFTPLRMSMRRLERLGLVLSLFVAMTLIGVWHGFTLPFLLYGLMQGAFMSVSALTLPQRDRLLARSRMPQAARSAGGIVAVYLMMTISQVFWRAASLASAVLHLRLLTGSLPEGPLGLSVMRTDIVQPVYLCMAAAFYHGAGAPGSARRVRPAERRLPAWVLGGAALLLISALSTEEGASFIYGQF